MDNNYPSIRSCLVRAHGGTIAASNREAGGARIVLSLPMAPVHV